MPADPKWLPTGMREPHELSHHHAEYRCCYESIAAIAARDDAWRAALEQAVAAVRRGPCKNDPCPVCGGGGPSGEWFEGCEVRCDDCGAMLLVTDIETCNGRSRFTKIPAPCHDPDHGDDCELECEDPSRAR